MNEKNHYLEATISLENEINNTNLNRVNNIIHNGFITAINATQTGFNSRVKKEKPSEAVKESASKYFHDALNGAIVGKPLKRTPLCVKGGNIFVEVDDEDIENKAQQYVYDVIERVKYQR